MPDSQPAYTFLNGTFSSLNSNNTANTTETAATAIWHMLQGFLGIFPEYAPNGTSSAVGVNLFAESYGGKFGPAFATLWEEQNQLRANGTLSVNNTLEINLVSLGIINGCVDDLIQAPYYPVMANNNTYGLTSINPTRATLANASFYAAGGCQDLINQCRTSVRVSDPSDTGNVSAVNDICASAYSSCVTNVMNPYLDASRSVYDIAHLVPDPFPPSTYLEYLNTATVQAGIGAVTNYTETNFQVVDAFTATGDYERDSLVPELAALLDKGIRIGFLYGDRDYICNWLGGEAISLAVAGATNASASNYSTQFPAAGYAPIIVNSSYIGGVVRQYGNLSFSRIYDAGHSVPAYQPETAFQVFARIIAGTSVSTGEAIDIASYNTSGAANATHTNSLPSSPTATCWVRNILNTCTQEQKDMLVAGTGTLIDGVLYDDKADWSSVVSVMTQTSSVSDVASTATVTETETTVATGVYVATATPSVGAGVRGRGKGAGTEVLWLGGVGVAYLVGF